MAASLVHRHCVHDRASCIVSYGMDKRPADQRSTVYLGTPLAKKLGIGANAHVVVLHAPMSYVELLEPLPPGVSFAARPTALTDIAHVFVDTKSTLKCELVSLREKLRGNATIWISWPKKSSKVRTDVTEDAIRELALPLGFVDVKVCAITDVWSGLKLVVRQKLR